VEATPIQLDVAVTYYTPAVGPQDASFSFSMFESATNGWPGALPPPSLATGVGTLLPGVTHFSASLNVDDLSQIYFTAFGSYLSGPFLIYPSIFVAEPPTGHVSDAAAFAFGPPWISLANLGTGLSGDLFTINGFSNQADGSFKVGTWEITAAPEPTTAVPEPTTLLLFGTGLAAAIRTRRMKRT
jgi:hypothetical protein